MRQDTKSALSYSELAHASNLPEAPDQTIEQLHVMIARKCRKLTFNDEVGSSSMVQQLIVLRMKTAWHVLCDILSLEGAGILGR
jgi:hypothetical protein